MPTSLHHRYVVAFQGKRDLYQVPIALAEVGGLGMLVTDLYCPDILTPLASRLPTIYGRKIAGRRSALLPSRLVDAKCPAAYWKAGADRIRRRSNNHQRYLETQWELGARAGKAAVENGYGGVIYSYQWMSYLSAFTRVSDSSMPRILFQVHPLPSQIRQVLSEDRRRYQHYHGELEMEELMPADQVRAYEQSLTFADGIIVSSNFTKQGFLAIGVPEGKIGVIPYGVYPPSNGRLCYGDARSTEPVHRAEPGSGPLKLLWVGQITYRKGLHHLLDALRLLPSYVAELTIVGRTIADHSLLDNLPSNVVVRGEVSAEQLSLLYSTHDLFVMPSLVEGFGHVYLEAMAHGLPVICTSNSGGADIVTDGDDGIVIQPGSSKEIADAILSAYQDRNWLDYMKSRALCSSGRWSWELFRREVCKFVRDVESHLMAPPPREAVHLLPSRPR